MDTTALKQRAEPAQAGVNAVPGGHIIDIYDGIEIAGARHVRLAALAL